MAENVVGETGFEPATLCSQSQREERISAPEGVKPDAIPSKGIKGLPGPCKTAAGGSASVDLPAAYLIWSNEHRAWWAPDRCGYTIVIERAGRYSREEAMAISCNARGGWAKGKNPPEIAIPEADALEQALCPTRYEAWANRGISA